MYCWKVYPFNEFLVTPAIFCPPRFNCFSVLSSFLILPALVRLDFEQRGFLQNVDQADEFVPGQLVVVDSELLAEQAGLALLCASLIAHGCLQLLPCGVGGVVRIGGGRVFYVRFLDIRDDLIEIVMHYPAEILVLIDLGQLQCPHVQIVFAGVVLFHDGFPRLGQDDVHIMHPHRGDTTSFL